jgi:hypothetical protein
MEKVPRRGKLTSMVWKNGENGFHGVEVFPKVASMAWKNGESGFHGVEVVASDDSSDVGGGDAFGSWRGHGGSLAEARGGRKEKGRGSG